MVGVVDKSVDNFLFYLFFEKVFHRKVFVT